MWKYWFARYVEVSSTCSLHIAWFVHFRVENVWNMLWKKNQVVLPNYKHFLKWEKITYRWHLKPKVNIPMKRLLDNQYIRSSFSERTTANITRLIINQSIMKLETIEVLYVFIAYFLKEKEKSVYFSIRSGTKAQSLKINYASNYEKNEMIM